VNEKTSHYSFRLQFSLRCWWKCKE